MKQLTIIEAILIELLNADSKHAPMAEKVEGLHTLKCEVQELEREIMRQNFDPELMLHEAIQVAAMAIKFLRDCCDMQLSPAMKDDPSINVPEPSTEIPVMHLAEDETGPMPGLSDRGREWDRFGSLVLNHIETYTVPQYGDMGEDRASAYNLETIKEHIGRYRDRIGSGARGDAEAMRDMIKIAHYACLGYSILHRQRMGVKTDSPA